MPHVTNYLFMLIPEDWTQDIHRQTVEILYSHFVMDEKVKRMRSGKKSITTIWTLTGDHNKGEHPTKKLLASSNCMKE